MSDNLVMKGIIQITGGHDSGKTNMALQAGATPEKTLFCDGDTKSKFLDGVVGRYVDLVEGVDIKESWQLYLMIQEMVDSIKPGDFDVVIFDPWTAVGKACRAYVEKYPKKFKNKYRGTSAMISGQHSRFGRELEHKILSTLRNKIPLIILTTHLTDDWSLNEKTGAQVPDNTKMLNLICNMRVWLRNNPSSPVPISLYFKRICEIAYSSESKRFETTNILPRKITPLDTDTSVWDAIKRFMNEPFGNREPSEDEIPDEYELSILDGTLTEDQRLALKIALKKHKAIEDVEEELQQVRQASDVDDDDLKKVKDCIDDGITSLPKIKKETGLSMSTIAKAKKLL